MTMQVRQSLPKPQGRTAIYARFSSDLQRDASIEDQIRICQARADKEGWQISETFTDFATSGATTLRPGYQAMLTAVRSGSIDVVLAESLDRFSRDLEHIASFHKQCVFHQVRIHTVGEGDISELHIGLKGTMGALYLKDLADKTRRGLEGRIHAGRCTGTPPYGYVVVRKMRDDGELDRGLRAIDPERAATVRRVFEAYAAGSSPRRIAVGLNAEGIAAPGGGTWCDSSILGRPKRGDGLLRNQLYVGRLVWRRRINVKDPMSGAQLRRDARPDSYLTKDMPELRIIDNELWRCVQERLKLEAAPPQPERNDQVLGFWNRRRPRHFLSGKVECGVCGRLLMLTGKDYLGCRSAKHGVCQNTRTVRRGPLEAHVLEVLSKQLMRPGLVAEFIAAYAEEYRRLASDLKTRAAAGQRERAAIDRKISNLVEAIGDGRSSPAILAKLTELETQRRKIADESVSDIPDAPPFQPNVAQSYAASVVGLQDSLARGDDPEAVEAAQKLVQKVIVYPPAMDGELPGIKVVGELIALLQAAGLGGARGSGPQVGKCAALDRFVSLETADPAAWPLLYKTAQPQWSG